jgi:hypothetical protein
VSQTCGTSGLPQQDPLGPRRLPAVLHHLRRAASLKPFRSKKRREASSWSPTITLMPSGPRKLLAKAEKLGADPLAPHGLDDGQGLDVALPEASSSSATKGSHRGRHDRGLQLLRGLGELVDDEDADRSPCVFGDPAMLQETGVSSLRTRRSPRPTGLAGLGEEVQIASGIPPSASLTSGTMKDASSSSAGRICRSMMSSRGRASLGRSYQSSVDPRLPHFQHWAWLSVRAASLARLPFVPALLMRAACARGRAPRSSARLTSRLPRVGLGCAASAPAGRLRQGHRQHTVLEGGADLIRVDGEGSRTDRWKVP